MTVLKRMTALILILVMVLSLAACGGGDKDNEAKDTLVFGSSWADATSLDPALDGSSKSMYIICQLYDPLFYYDDEDGIIPAIAESYEISEDGMEYTIKIRDNAYFHDGSKIMASDVVFTL